MHLVAWSYNHTGYKTLVLLVALVPFFQFKAPRTSRPWILRLLEHMQSQPVPDCFWQLLAAAEHILVVLLPDC